MRSSPAKGGFDTATLSVVAVAGLAASAFALGLAPLLMPDDYSWIGNTTSESAAQGVPNAWLARLGLVLFGLSVIACTVALANAWSRVASALHVAFGVLLVASAVFSTRSWRAGGGYDRTEDAVHSFAATAMGFAFALGVVAVLLADGDRGWRRALGVVAVAASVVLPLGMAAWSDGAGLLQRAMFVIAYGWCAAQLLNRPRDGGAAR